MKSVRFMGWGRVMTVCAAVAIAPAAMAQKWEFGGGVGGSFYTSRDATNNGLTASAGIKTDAAGSLWLVNNNHKNWSGEVRFDNFGGHWGDQRELDKLLQSYAVERTRLEARRAGHTLLEQSLPDGSVKLTIQVKGGGR